MVQNRLLQSPNFLFGKAGGKRRTNYVGHKNYVFLNVFSYITLDRSPFRIICLKRAQQIVLDSHKRVLPASARFRRHPFYEYYNLKKKGT